MISSIVLCISLVLSRPALHLKPEAQIVIPVFGFFGAGSSLLLASERSPLGEAEGSRGRNLEMRVMKRIMMGGWNRSGPVENIYKTY